MKYKILKSVAHNFSHSFVSYMNYVDDGYVIDDLLQLARKANGERLKINWIPDTASEQFLTPRVVKSVASYKEWLPKFFENSGASIEVFESSEQIFFLNRTRELR